MGTAKTIENTTFYRLSDRLNPHITLYRTPPNGLRAAFSLKNTPDFGPCCPEVERRRHDHTLVELINAMEVREDDDTFKNAVDLMFDALEERSPDHFAVRQYKKYRLAAGVVS